MRAPTKDSDSEQSVAAATAGQTERVPVSADDDVDGPALDATFVAKGSLAGASEHGPLPAGLRVTAFRVVEDDRQRLGSGPVSEGGRWRLPDLPADGVSPLVFRLEGSGVATREVSRPAPRPATEIDVRFELAPAQKLIVFLTDFDENPIPGAQLQASWTTEQSEVFSSVFSTDEGGVGELVEPPAGNVFVHVEKQGYSGGRFGPHRLQGRETEALALRIGRSGRIVGRCVRGEQPVNTFTIRYWKDAPGTASEHRVSGQADGSFVIEDAPLGTVELLASSPDCPGTPLQTVEVLQASDAWIEIELPASGTAMGLVRDAGSGSPVTTARVQVFTTASGQSYWPWREPFATDSLGEFRGVPVSDPLTMLEISAPGYATVTRRALEAPGGVYDCGAIDLPRSQELLVRLIGSGGEDFTQYNVSVEGSGVQEQVRCDEDGSARFAKVSPGRAWVTVTPPTSTTYYLDVILNEGEEWLVDVPVDTGNRVVVEVRDQDGSPPSEVLWAGISYVSPEGYSSHYYEELDREGRVTFTCASEGMVVFDIQDEAFQLVAMRSAAIDPTGSTFVSIQLDLRDYRLRLLDAEANLMPSTPLTIMLPDNPVPWGHRCTTDQEGLVTLRGFEATTVTVNVQLPEGSASGIPVNLGAAAGDEPIDVRVDANGGIDLVVLDGDQPLPSIWVFLNMTKGGRRLVRSLSDSEGRVELGALAPRSYSAEVDYPGYWPATLEVEASIEQPSYVMQVRRLGSLWIQVARGGQPAQVVGIELVSKEFSQSAQVWLAAGMITTSSGSMVTDQDGELVLYGIPHGAYSWSVLLEGGSTSNGEVSVLPREVSSLAIELP